MALPSTANQHHVSFAAVPSSTKVGERVTFNDCKNSEQLRNRFLESGYSLSPTRDLNQYDTEEPNDSPAVNQQQLKQQPATPVSQGGGSEFNLLNTHSLQSQYGTSATEDVEITRPTSSTGLGLVFHDCTVVKVHAASPASRAQMRPGDVVVMINGTKVQTYSELHTLISQNNSTGICLTVLKNPPPLPEHMIVAEEQHADTVPLNPVGPSGVLCFLNVTV